MLNVEASYRRTSKERERRGFLSATPERMAKTGEPFQDIRTVDDKGNSVETQTITASPLDRLYKVGALGTDKEFADLRYEAGQRFYGHWYYGRSFSLGSRDYRKPYTGSSNDPYSLAPSQERVEFHRSKWRTADATLGGDRIASVTRAIVLEEKEPLLVGRTITGRNHEQTARAIAIEYLIDGLDRLRALWEMRA